MNTERPEREVVGLEYADPLYSMVPAINHVYYNLSFQPSKLVESDLSRVKKMIADGVPSEALMKYFYECEDAKVYAGKDRDTDIGDAIHEALDSFKANHKRVAKTRPDR